MKTSALFTLVCLCALLCISQAASSSWPNPCQGGGKKAMTTLASLQGVWRGTCSRLIAPINASDPNTAYKCSSKVDTYPYEAVYNGTNVGANISGFVAPLDKGKLVASSPVDTYSRLMLADLELFPGFVARGMIHVGVACIKNKPTYTEAVVHTLASANIPAYFPVPLARDVSKLWCNDKTSEDSKGHAAASFNIVCTAPRLRDVGARWP